MYQIKRYSVPINPIICLQLPEQYKILDFMLGVSDLHIWVCEDISSAMINVEFLIKNSGEQVSKIVEYVGTATGHALGAEKHIFRVPACLK